MSDYEDATGKAQDRPDAEIKSDFKRAMFARAPLWQKMRALIRSEIEAERTTGDVAPSAPAQTEA
mgnify:CR=1 FL=1